MAPPLQPPPPNAPVEAVAVMSMPVLVLPAAAGGEDPAAMLPSPTTSSSSSASTPSPPPPPPPQTPAATCGDRLRRRLRSASKWATAGVWRSPPETAHLDGLRGVACLTVMVWHFVCGFYPGIAFNDPGAVPPEAPYNPHLGVSKLLLFFNGPFCVDVFYVLSGFVLCYGYLGHGRNATLASAMVRRLPRLLGSFAAVALLAWQLGKWGWVDQGARAAEVTRSSWLAQPTLGSGVGALSGGNVGAFILSTFTEGSIGAWRRYPRNLWTIRTEFRGSFVVFLLAFLMKTLPAPRARWLLYPPIMYWYSLEFDGALQSFVLGLFLADLQRNTRILSPLPQKPSTTTSSDRAPPIARAARALLTAAALGWWLYAQATYGHARKSALPPGDEKAAIRFNRAVAWGAASALLFLQLVGPAHPLLASPPARFVGYISFSLYLLHAEVYSTLTSHLFLQWRPVLGYHGAAWAALGASLPVIVLLAWALTLLVDDPTVRYTRVAYGFVFGGYDPSRTAHRWLRRRWERGVVAWWEAFKARGPVEGGWLWWLLCVDEGEKGVVAGGRDEEDGECKKEGGAIELGDGGARP